MGEMVDISDCTHVQVDWLYTFRQTVRSTWSLPVVEKAAANTLTVKSFNGTSIFGDEHSDDRMTSATIVYGHRVFTG